MKQLGRVLKLGEQIKKWLEEREFSITSIQEYSHRDATTPLRNIILVAWRWDAPFIEGLRLNLWIRDEKISTFRSKFTYKFLRIDKHAWVSAGMAICRYDTILLSSRFPLRNKISVDDLYEAIDEVLGKRHVMGEFGEAIIYEDEWLTIVNSPAIYDEVAIIPLFFLIESTS